VALGVLELLAHVLVNDHFVVNDKLTTIVRVNPDSPLTRLRNGKPALVLNDILVTSLVIDAVVRLNAPVDFLSLNPRVDGLAVDFWEFVEPLPATPLFGLETWLARILLGRGSGRGSKLDSLGAVGEGSENEGSLGHREDLFKL